MFVNGHEVMLRSPSEYREANENFQFLNGKDAIKTPGIVWWSPIKDNFKFDQLVITKILTERQILSDIAKVFDPWLAFASHNAIEAVIARSLEMQNGLGSYVAF